MTIVTPFSLLACATQAQSTDPTDPSNYSVTYASSGATDAYTFDLDATGNVTPYHFHRDWATGSMTLNNQAITEPPATPYQNRSNSIATISCTSQGTETITITWIGLGGGPSEVPIIIDSNAEWAGGGGSAINGLSSPMVAYEYAPNCTGEEAYGHMLRRIKLTNKTGLIQLEKTANATSFGSNGTAVYANAQGVVATVDTRNVLVEMAGIGNHYKAVPNGTKTYSYTTHFDVDPKDGYHTSSAVLTRTYNGFGAVPVELDYRNSETNFAHWDMGLTPFVYQLIGVHNGIQDPKDPLYPDPVITQFLGFQSGSPLGFNYSWSDSTSGSRPDNGNWAIPPISISKLPSSQVRLMVDEFTPAIKETWYEDNDSKTTYNVSLIVNWSDGTRGKAVREIHLHPEAEVNAQILEEIFDDRAGVAPFHWFVFADGQEYAAAGSTSKSVVVDNRELQAVGAAVTSIAVAGLLATLPEFAVPCALIGAALDQDVFFQVPQPSTEILNRDGHNKVLLPKYSPFDDPASHRSNINNYQWKCQYRLGAQVVPTITNKWYAHGFGGQLEEPLIQEETLFQGYRRYYLKCTLLHPFGGGGGNDPE